MSENNRYSLSEARIAEAYEDLFFKEAMAINCEEESAEIEKELMEMPALSEEEIERRKKEFAQWLYEGSYLFRIVFCMGLIAMIFVCGKYGVGYDPADFIYMQF